MAAKEIDVVKRLLLDLTKELTEKGLVAQGWPETMEIVFDKKARDSLEKSLMDAKEGRVSFLTWDELFGGARMKASNSRTEAKEADRDG